MSHEQEDFEDYPLAYSIDNAILLHRDAHFSGSFPLMLAYYASDGKGVSKDFEISRIEEMFLIEKNEGKNLSPVLLSGAEAEKVARSKNFYKQLRDVYEIKNPKSPIPKLIADLILADDEKEIENAVEGIVDQKSTIVPYLIDILRNDDLYDPLFPGYGLAPELAAKCLGLIGDKRAIISLFEAIGEGDFFNDDIMFEALHAIGQPAKEFLLRVLHAHPITFDNERAAIALVQFKNDPEVSEACLTLLKTLDLKKEIAFATYLVLACENLTSNEQRQELLEIAKSPSIPKNLQLDIAIVAKTWGNQA